MVSLEEMRRKLEPAKVTFGPDEATRQVARARLWLQADLTSEGLPEKAEFYLVFMTYRYYPKRVGVCIGFKAPRTEGEYWWAIVSSDEGFALNYPFHYPEYKGIATQPSCRYTESPPYRPLGCEDWCSSSYIAVFADDRETVEEAIRLLKEHFPFSYDLDLSLPKTVCKETVAPVGFRIRNKGIVGNIRVRGYVRDLSTMKTYYLWETTLGAGNKIDFVKNFPVTASFRPEVSVDVELPDLCLPRRTWRNVVRKTLTPKILEPRIRVEEFKLNKPAFCPDERFKVSARIVALNCPQRLRIILSQGTKVLRRVENIVLWPNGPSITIEGENLVGWTPAPVSLRIERLGFERGRYCWKTIYENNIPIKLKKLPDLEVVSAEIPKYAIPGYSYTMSYTVKNVGECRGSFVLDVFRGMDKVYTNRFSLNPGEESTKVITFVSPVKDVTVRSEFIREDPWHTSVLSEEFTLKAVRSCRISLSEKVMTITAGENKLRFVGTLVGRGFSSPLIVRREQTRVLGVLPIEGTIIAGTLSPFERETITFSELHYAHVVFDSNVSYVLENSLRKKDTKEVQYSSISLPFMYPFVEDILKKLEE